MDVTCAGGAGDALRLLKEALHQGQRFQLAVLDMRMPGMNGLELSREINALHATAPKLLMLGSTYAPEVSGRPDAGILWYLNKPPRRADLQRTLLEMLAGTPVAPPSETAVAKVQSGRVVSHVLLVEDNAINRSVAAQMLQKLGFQVTVAGNGLEAVDLVREQPFDLVLMDCQMPQMDGFTATRLIRDWEARMAREWALPIVALTANAMAGDREACFAAGMSDYMTKPISGAALAEVLARHLVVARTAEKDEVRARGDAVTATPPVFDRALLESLPMIADGSNPEYASHLLNLFRNNSAELLQRFGNAGRMGDIKEQMRSVHNLKSSSAQIGLLAFAALAERVESNLRSGSPPETDHEARLQVELRRALAAVESYLENRSDA